MKKLPERMCMGCRYCVINQKLNRRECHFYAPHWLSGAGTGCVDELWPEVDAENCCGLHSFKELPDEEV